MPPLKCSVADGGVLATILKMQKKVLSMQSKLMIRVQDLETIFSARSSVTHRHSVKCDKWICPVCLRGFPERDTLKGHVRYCCNASVITTNIS